MSKTKLKQPLNIEPAVPREAGEAAPPALRRYLPFLLLLFVGSGCAALIYEVVWFQLLQLVIGSSAVSLGVLLGTYMGGMCLGSLLLPRYVSAREHPLRVYALIEVGIGVCGVLVLFGVPLLDQVYAAIAGHGAWGIVLRAVLAAICLLPPTLLMGASLPAIARWVEATPEGVSWLGFFYGGNIAGAVFGCLLAGFYLLRVHDMAIATYVAVAINVAVALLSFRLSEKTGYASQEVNVPERSGPSAGRGVGLYRDCAFGIVRAGSRSGLDAAAVADDRRDGVHVFDHSRRLSDRTGIGQRGRVAFIAREESGRRSRWPCARCCWRRRSRGPRTCSPTRFPTGR